MSFYRIRQKSSGLYFKKEGFTKTGVDFATLDDVQKGLDRLSSILSTFDYLNSVGANLNKNDYDISNLEIVEFDEVKIIGLKTEQRNISYPPK